MPRDYWVLLVRIGIVKCMLIVKCTSDKPLKVSTVSFTA